MHHRLTTAIAQAHRVLLTAPSDLDADAIGALAALAIGIRRRWPRCEVRLMTADAPAPNEEFILEPDVHIERPAPYQPDLAIVVDGGPERLGVLEATFDSAPIRAQIDHHRSASSAATHIPIIDREAASTTLLVLDLLDRWGVMLDAQLAQAIFAGLVYDTSLFRYRLTSPKALRAAARCLETGIDHARIVEYVLLEQSESKARLRGHVTQSMPRSQCGRFAWALLTADDLRGASAGGLVDDLVFIHGVEVGALLMERNGMIKLSIRSRGSVDVSTIAQSLSPKGGGHARAAGATIEGSLTTTEAALLAAVTTALEGSVLS